MGLQTYLCPLCMGRHYLEIGGEAMVALQSVMKSLNATYAKSVLRAAGVRSMPKAVKARDVKKLAERLSDKGTDRFTADQPKMIGVLVVDHADGKKSRFLAQSGGEDLELTDVAGGFTVVRDRIDKNDPRLPRLFSDGEVRAEQLESLDSEAFTANCAAMKMLIAVAEGCAEVRGGSGIGRLATRSPITKLTMAEELYRPFTMKLAPGFRQYTRGDFGDEETTTLAPSCSRCQQKVPVMICPVKQVKEKRIDIFGSARHLVATWEQECHGQPWGKRGKQKEYV